jgi:hypothetical protein
MPYATLLLTHSGPIAPVILNHPERRHCLNREALPGVKKLNGVRTEAAELCVCLCVAERREDR